MITGQITIKLYNPDRSVHSERLVSATRIDLLAVHRTIDSMLSYTLTHVPTSRRIALFDTEQNAIECMRALQGIDWDFDRNVELGKSTYSRTLTPPEELAIRRAVTRYFGRMS